MFHAIEEHNFFNFIGRVPYIRIHLAYRKNRYSIMNVIGKGVTI